MVDSAEEENSLVYFYLPSGEGLNALYFLYEKYKQKLCVITCSKSIIEVAEILDIKFLIPDFDKTQNKFNRFMGFERLRNSVLGNIFNNILRKIYDLILAFSGYFASKKTIGRMPSGSIVYNSTFFYDVIGIIFFGLLVKSKKFDIRLISPRNFMEFDHTESEPILSSTYILNKFNSNIFSFHVHSSFGKVVGINPRYLETNSLSYFHKDEEFNSKVPANFAQKTLNHLRIFSSNKRKILFLGDYSIENSIEFYGEKYLEILKILADSKNFEVYFKPHPHYHSIEHPLLKNFNVLKTQLPVEFLDDSIWHFIIGLATASFLSPKKSKVICLVKLKELQESSILKLDEFSDQYNKISNRIIFPESLINFRSLVS